MGLLVLTQGVKDNRQTTRPQNPLSLPHTRLFCYTCSSRPQTAQLFGVIIIQQQQIQKYILESCGSLPTAHAPQIPIHSSKPENAAAGTNRQRHAAGNSP